MDRITLLHVLFLALAGSAFMSVASAEDAQMPVKVRIIECGIAENLTESCFREPLCCAFLKMDGVHNDESYTPEAWSANDPVDQSVKAIEPLDADIYHLDYVFE